MPMAGSEVSAQPGGGDRGVGVARRGLPEPFGWGESMIAEALEVRRESRSVIVIGVRGRRDLGRTLPFPAEADEDDDESKEDTDDGFDGS